MTQPSHDTLTAAGRSFAEHLAAFHAGLPAEQQALLEQLVALAERATDSSAETEGFMLGGLAGPPPGSAAAQDLRLLLRTSEDQFSFVMRVNKASPK